MSATSFELPDPLMMRVLAASQRKGISPQAFMEQAIEQAVLAAEQRAAFVREAMTAHQEMLASGQGFDGDEVHGYIAARVAGTNPSRPKARAWRK